MGCGGAQVEGPALVGAIKIGVGPVHPCTEGIAAGTGSDRNIVHRKGRARRDHGEGVGSRGYFSRIRIIAPCFHDGADTGEGVVAVAGVVHALEPVRHQDHRPGNRDGQNQRRNHHLDDSDPALLGDGPHQSVSWSVQVPATKTTSPAKSSTSKPAIAADVISVLAFSCCPSPFTM